MRALVCHRYGTAEELEVENVPDPVPQRGQVVVDVAAAAVNFPDNLLIANAYQVPASLPFVPGSEFSGVVSSVGAGTTWSIGDRVFGSAMTGAFAEKVLIDGQRVRRVPRRAPLMEMAGFWVAHATAYHALRSTAEASKDDVVVVLGAGGGVGLAAVELAAALGCTVIAAASSEDKRAACRERGAAATVDYVHGDLRAAIKQIAPSGADIVLDPVGGPASEAALRSTRWGGRFVTIGFASGEIPRIPLNLVLLKGVVVKGFEIRTFGEHAPSDYARNERELLALVDNGTITPTATARYPLDQAVDALVAVRDRKAVGKVLVVP